MAIPAKSKYVMDGKPALRSGLTLFCTRDHLACQWTRLVLAEKDVDGARIEWVLPGKPNHDLAVLNPAGTLPTLTDRDAVIYPASVIVEYLDERYPHPRLLPTDPVARARIRMFIGRIEHEVYPLAETLMFGRGEGKLARKQLAELLLEVSRLFPARGWFLGLDYSLVDCAWAVLFPRLHSLGLKLPADAQHAIVKYAERLFARPAFRTLNR
jgi:stringent starvation protein A